MKTPATHPFAGLKVLLLTATLGATAAPAAPPMALSNTQDHQLMMDVLGITSLRTGPTGNLAGDGTRPPNYANYDEDKSASKTKVPELMVLNNGRKVTTPAQWAQRRAEIQEIFDREFYGRMPEAAKSIKVTWTVTGTSSGTTGGIPTITRQLVGHVDNSSYPAISVEIGASVTTPANATGKVPVIITFGGGGGAGAGVTAETVPPTAELLKASTPSLTDGQIAAILALNTGGGGARGGGARGTAPGGAGARGFGAGAPVNPLTIDNLKTALTLTEAQVAQITPALDEINKAQQGVTDLQTKATDLRNGAADKINPILTEAQRPLLAQALNPRAGGPGGPGGFGGGRGGAGGGALSGVQLALAHGWGYGSINPGSIQADSGGGLTSGIIGLINKGQPRKPDDWGSLRAWAWGADRLLDFFETDNLVDAKQVGFEGHSRYGKATIVTLAYDQRAAIGYVSSSGEGGAKIWRHLMGEQVENLAGSGEYHWMAGNFLKYGGPMTVDDLPADAHELVAMVAPRPVFISGGKYADVGGDSWQDSHGMMQAAAGASPAYVLLGKKELSNAALGIKGLTVTSELPPILTPLIDGDVAFRQHDQGHTDGPNWETFMEFSSRYLHAPGKN